MFFHICLLIEPFITILEFADKRFFLSVNSQMIEKVMPLSKHFATIFMRAAKQSNHSSVRLKASEFINVKLRSLWSIMWLNGCQIKILSF